MLPNNISPICTTFLRCSKLCSETEHSQSYEIFLISSFFYIQVKNPLLATFLFLAATHCAIHQSGMASSNQACRPINATISAEKDDCPVCMAITTTICSGYCKTKVREESPTKHA